MTDDSLIRFEEKTVFKLRSIYRKYGYLPYKMSKFEEYELYIRNKDFLVSDRVLAFNDTNGKLMALKPDVTLSIIKNGDDISGCKQKVFYNENVYRVSESTHRFKEIMQTGLECIGDIDIYDIYEVITLAARSLKSISDNFRLEISNMDIVCSIVSGVCPDACFVEKALKFISEKNMHDLSALCSDFGVDSESCGRITSLISLYGKRSDVLAGLKRICPESKLNEISLLSDMLDKFEFSDSITFDFSVINDMNYYNGFVFKGFIDGIFCGVLAGGQYDNMMRKMNRDSGAIGFALYLDRLDDLRLESEKYDVDRLIIYDDAVSPCEIAETVEKLVLSGETVSTQKSVPEKLRYKTILDLRKGD